MRKVLLRIRTLFRIAKGLGIAVWLAVTLAVSTAGLALEAAKTTAQLAVVTAQLAGKTAKVAQQATTITKQSKAIKSLKNNITKSKRKFGKQIAKAKAKGRLRRTVTSVPLLGVAAAIAFEEVAFRGWLKENPGGSRGQYGCEVWGTTLEVADDVLAELPEGWVRRWARKTVEGMPSCEQEKEPLGPPMPPFIGPLQTPSERLP
ncbi:MAG: hypothetical protein GXP03_12780 [Alphaproteobacteria bacterium]|nr:hypothetical protein [Alphaproteobacteria bacterium]